MKYSAEEIYLNYGQYDTFVIIEFQYNSDEYNRFGNTLSGNFLYTLEERNKYEKVLQSVQIPRTDNKIKFSPSPIEKLSFENIEILDRYGIQASSINIISFFNIKKENRFLQKGTKEIPGQITIQAPKINGFKELNRLNFNFLNSIYKSRQPFTPNQEIEYWGLRTHLQIETNLEDFLNIKNRDKDFLKKIRFVELESKLQESSIDEEQIKEYGKLVVENLFYKNDIIDKEIKKSGERINLINKKFNTQIKKLRNCCHQFDEYIFIFGEIPIYLSFERFVHIYARHVAETQIGENFSGKKTVFQYKFEEIINLIKMVIKSVQCDIQIHFKKKSELQFIRIGKRAVYVDGHYYRLVIEPNGSILDFHPFNINEE